MTTRLTKKRHTLSDHAIWGDWMIVFIMHSVRPQLLPSQLTSYIDITQHCKFAWTWAKYCSLEAKKEKIYKLKPSQLQIMQVLTADCTTPTKWWKAKQDMTNSHLHLFPFTVHNVEFCHIHSSEARTGIIVYAELVPIFFHVSGMWRYTERETGYCCKMKGWVDVATVAFTSLPSSGLYWASATLNQRQRGRNAASSWHVLTEP